MQARSEAAAHAGRKVLAHLGAVTLTLILVVAANFLTGQATHVRAESNAAPAVRAQNAPTPVMIPVSPNSANRSQPRATPTPRPRVFPAELKGMIVFLSDLPPAAGYEDLITPIEEYDSESETMQLSWAYALDPVTGQINLLSASWPHQCALKRDTSSANRQYRVFVQGDVYILDDSSDYEDDPIEEPTEEPTEEPIGEPIEEPTEEPIEDSDTPIYAQSLVSTQVEDEEDDTEVIVEYSFAVGSRDQCGDGVKDDQDFSFECSTHQCRIYYYDRAFSTCKPATFFGHNPYADDDAWGPAWSPISDQVAFVGNESGNDEIYVVAKDRWPPQRLTTNTWAWDKHPSWSPDGTQIVFMSNRSGSRQLWLMNADGTDQRLLTNWAFEAWNPVWVKYVGEDGCP